FSGVGISLDSGPEGRAKSVWLKFSISAATDSGAVAGRGLFAGMGQEISFGSCLEPAAGSRAALTVKGTSCISGRLGGGDPGGSAWRPDARRVAATTSPRLASSRDGRFAFPL